VVDPVGLKGVFAQIVFFSSEPSKTEGQYSKINIQYSQINIPKI
jgi:hypothetical protein